MLRSVSHPTRSQPAARQAAWLCAALLCAMAHGVRAQAPAPATAPAPAPTTQAAEADALILQGLKLREQGQDAGALQLFERAYELAPTPRALAQRALAEQALGSWVQAEEHLRAALEQQDDPWIAQYNEALVRSLATIGDHLGRLQVNGGREGAELRIDGQRVGQLPLAAPLRVVVGRSLLEVVLEGYYPVRREITVKAGALSTETIELQPVPPAQSAAHAELQATGSLGSADRAADSAQPAPLPAWVFLTGAAVTAALGGVTLWSGLNALAKNDEYENYAKPGADFETAKLGHDRAKSAQDRTNILIGATAAAGVATAVIGIFFTDWGGSEEAHAARRSLPPATLYADGTGFGLVLDQRF